MNINIIFSILFLIGCTTKTDHMGMRAITTKPYNDSLGCKKGHLWRLVKDDEWVDIGPVTDSCNCNYIDHHPPLTLMQWMDSASKHPGKEISMSSITYDSKLHAFILK